METRLNLIDPTKSDIKYEKFLFPDGQPHIKFESYVGGEELRIITRISSMNDLMWLVQATDTLTEFMEHDLEISYLMGARMDRQMSDLEPFTLSIVADVLDMCPWRSVSIFDPHSNKALELIDHSKAISNLLFIKNVLKDINKEGLVLVSPDKGAVEKTAKLAEAFSRPVLYCEKTRDKATGKLSNPVVPYVETMVDRPLLIVDDICDGGGTFIQLHDELRRQGYTGDIYLAISHGIFSKGFGVFYRAGENKRLFKQIYTTNSYKDWSKDMEAFALKTINLW